MQELMTLERLKKILEARGFRIERKPDGSMSLRGDRRLATPGLLTVLAYWRDELALELSNGSHSIREGVQPAPKAEIQRGKKNVDGVLPGS